MSFHGCFKFWKSRSNVEGHWFILIDSWMTWWLSSKIINQMIYNVDNILWKNHLLLLQLLLLLLLQLMVKILKKWNKKNDKAQKINRKISLKIKFCTAKEKGMKMKRKNHTPWWKMKNARRNRNVYKEAKAVFAFGMSFYVLE